MRDWLQSSGIPTMRDYTTQEMCAERIAAIVSPPAIVLDPPAAAEVWAIVYDVFDRGDEALVDNSRKFDWPDARLAGLRISPDEIRAADHSLTGEDEAALRAAIDHVREFHESQLPENHSGRAEYGATLGWQYTAIESVGVYVPAGTAPLASTVVMSVVPAQVAGVKRIAVTTPPQRDGSVNAPILAAAHMLGVSEIYRVGGPWAIAALAKGTATIPAVDKIVGPGNIYVNLAKTMVAGVVGIDGFYGPSEVVILADEHARPEYIAADLVAQAEHSPDSLAVLITPSTALLAKVVAELERAAGALSRADTVRRSLDERAATVLVGDLSEGIEVVNLLAPEHLELMIEDPGDALAQITNAGCILVGPNSPTAVSDYMAGPSHVLPTQRAARFSSGLSVMDFLKRSSVVSITAEWLRQNGRHVERLAGMEGLEGHARSVRLRIEKDDR